MHPASTLLAPRVVRLVLLAAGAPGLIQGAIAGEPTERGERIYRERCVRCHGESGVGVEARHPEPLAGDKTILELARFIEKSMPEDKPGTCSTQDAQDVARYIHDAFYSPIAQARNRKARIELSHLTVRQYRNAAADLIGSFRDPPPRAGGRGLRAEYFNSGRPGRGGAVERIDGEVRFDFGRSNPAPDKLGTQGFAARWEGSVEAPDTGDYEFIVHTDHAVRLWVNDLERPLFDAWVKSGKGTEFRASRFLIGGRAYPLRLEFSSRKQGVQDKKKGEEKPVLAFIDLSWKPPNQAEQVIPSRCLSPERGPEVFVVGTPFPPDDQSVGYERATSISRAWDEAATGAAIETAGYVAAHLEELAGLRQSGSDRQARVREFAIRFVQEAFRRPLDDEDRRLYVDHQFDRAPDPETAVKRVLILALQSPRFLYLDLGAGAPDAHSVAARLSFALWDSLPDRQLREAAALGQLASRPQAARQAERMIGDPRTRAKVREFLHRWLKIEPVPDLMKDREHFPGFDEPLASDLRTSLDMFLDQVVWGEGSDFRQLFLSSDLYLNGRAGRYYGLELAEDAPFERVRSKEPRTAGVLSHPYLLARFAYTDSTSPIHRGVFILRSLLGQVLRPPPEAFVPLSSAQHPELTTRERVAWQTEPESCQGCHGKINPLGFALERFDAVGRYREQEGGKPIDATGGYRLPSGETRTFNGARELGEFLAGSEEAQRAFVSQLFHYLVKQPILAYGSQTPADLRRTFASTGFDVPRLLAEIAATAAWAGAGLTAAASPPDPPVLSDHPRQRRF